MRTATFLSAGCFCLSVMAADKPDFSGSWRQDAKESAAGTLVIVQQPSGSIRLQENEPNSEISCNTLGKECEVKISGKPAKVRYYYNGPMLVEWRFEGREGKQATKIRRKLSEDGRKMTVEIMGIEPPSASKELTFVKVEETSSTAAKR